MTEKYIILNEISFLASELFLKYSYNFANFSLDILIKCILTQKKKIIRAYCICKFSTQNYILFKMSDLG